MRRRAFLTQSSRAALGLWAIPLGACARGKHPSGAPKSAAQGQAVITELERVIPELMAEHRVPGLSIALVKDAKMAWRRGFGVKDNKSREPVDNDTVFEAASVSKTVFAYAALKLCEQGGLGLDTPLTQYTRRPRLTGDARLDLITARHALSHTTGFQNWATSEHPLKIDFIPGAKYSYSGEGYHYLQSVVTDLAGQPVESFIRARVFAPFGMSSSGYVWNDTFEKHAARPHDPTGKPLANRKRTQADAERYAAAGDLHTTPTDYAKFLREVLQPKRSDPFRLNQASLREMVRPQVKVDDQTSWALGWQIRHTPQGNVIQHGGDNTGFHAFVWASVERKSGFIVMTNGENGWKLFFHPPFVGIVDRFLFG